MSTIAEYRRNTIYTSPSSRERRAAEGAGQSVAELRAAHLDEKRDLEQRQRHEGKELRRKQQREATEEHRVGPPHAAPLLDAKHKREREALDRRHADQHAALAAPEGSAGKGDRGTRAVTEDAAATAVLAGLDASSTLGAEKPGDGASAFYGLPQSPLRRPSPTARRHCRRACGSMLVVLAPLTA